MRAFRLLPLLVVTAGLQACMHYAAPASPSEIPPEEFPRVVQLTLTDGSRLRLESARVVDSTVIGTRRDDLQRFQIPLAQVAKVEAQRLSMKRTATLAGVLASGAFVVWAYLQEPTIEAVQGSAATR